jgi:YfiH family protein
VIDIELPNARAVFTTREGGVSEGAYASLNVGLLTGDDADNVIANRRRVAELTGLGPEAIAIGQQVHGTAIERWGAPPDPDRLSFVDPLARLPEVDGHTTARHGLGLFVQVADCYPVALASAQRVAMLHCGWRGLASGIVEHALSLFEMAPAAAVGPGIGGCCYEVSPEVVERFGDVEDAADGRMLDLRRVIDVRLRAGGVERIEHVDLCTSCRGDLFFSHRRDEGATGRQCGIVWRP